MAQLYFFFKAECAPCAEKKPLVTAWAEELRVPLVYVNAPSCPDIVERLRVRSVPTVVVVDRDGQRVAGFAGGMITRAAIERALALT